jgi:P pilus assembly chaperone PapD
MQQVLQNVQIVANRPGSANTELKWNEQSDRWTFTNDGTTYYNLPTSTTDVAEGANLYYSNARVNSFIQNNITTTDIDEGTNLYFTAARARGNISAAENITYNSSTGVIGLANTLAKC